MKTNKKQLQLLISFSSDMESTADNLALSVYYMGQNHRLFAGRRFVPRRVTSEADESEHRASWQKADLCLYLYGAGMDASCEARFRMDYKLGQLDSSTEGKKLLLFTSVKDADEILAHFTTSQDSKYGNFCAYFANDHHLKLLVAEQLWLTLGQQEREWKVKHDGQSLILDDGMQISLKELPFVAMNPSFVDKEQLLDELQSQQDKLKSKMAKYPDNADFANEHSDLTVKIEKTREAISKELDLVLAQSIQLAKWRTKQVSKRLRCAMRDFDHGNISGAINWLKNAEKDAENALDTIGEIASTHLEELRFKINLYNADGRLTITERVSMAYAAYKIFFKIARHADMNEVELAEAHFECAHLCSLMNRFTPAMKHYECCLNMYEKLAKQQPENFEPNLSRILNKIGLLYCISHRFAKAEVLYLRCLDILEKLAEQQPETFLPDLAAIFNNLGALYISIQNLTKAEVFFQRSLSIYEKLTEQQPEAFLPNIAMILHCLGLLYNSTQSIAKAEVFFQRSLDIYEKLIERQPETTEPDLAEILSRLAFLYSEIKSFAKAEALYLRCLDILEKLAEQQPEVFEPELARILNALGDLYHNTKSLAKAEAFLQRSLNIYEKLAERQPEIFEAHLVNSLFSFARLCRCMNQVTQEHNSWLRIYELSQKLKSNNPSVFQPIIEALTELIENPPRES